MNDEETMGHVPIFHSWIDKSSLLLYRADIDLITAKLENIVNSLGEKHLSWFEHKGSNQCRICDLIVMCSKLINSWDEEHIYNAKSSLDSMNESKDYQYNSALDQEPLP